MIDRSKLSPDGEKTMVEIEAQLMELCKQLTESVQRMAKPSRREQRRARKAKKNAVMYKTYGRRPWLSRKPYGENERDDFINTYDVMARRAFTPVWGGRCDPYAEFLSDRINHLREPSGFKAMSRLADGVTK